MNKRPPKQPPRLVVLTGGRMEKKRRAELQRFIKACEALYEKNIAHRKEYADHE